MYIETRFYDNGMTRARMHKTRPSIKQSDKYDVYIDKYDTLEEFSEDLEELGDYKSQMFLDLKAGRWVDITAYC